MSKTSALALAALLAAVSGLGFGLAARASDALVPPPATGILEGTWEGTFQATSPTTQQHSVSSEITLRLVLEDGVGRIFNGQGGSWEEVLPGRFKVESLGSNVLVYSVGSGRIPTPEGSRWFETYLLAVAANSEDTLVGRWVRVVNHPDLAPDDPDRAFTVDGEVSMRKVAADSIADPSPALRSEACLSSIGRFEVALREASSVLEEADLVAARTLSNENFAESAAAAADVAAATADLEIARDQCR